MKLPNGDRVVVDDAKLLDYCLSTTHPRGRHKARLFAAACGFDISHAPQLKTLLLQAAVNSDATPTHANPFGQLYETLFDCRHSSVPAKVLAVWIVHYSDSIPRLVTCYPT